MSKHGQYFITARDGAGERRVILGPLSPLTSREGWQQRHRDAHRRENRTFTISIDRNYPLS